MTNPMVLGAGDCACILIDRNMTLNLLQNHIVRLHKYSYCEKLSVASATDL